MGLFLAEEEEKLEFTHYYTLKYGAKQEIYKFVVGIYEKIGYTRKASKKEGPNRLPACKKAVCADLAEAGEKRRQKNRLKGYNIRSVLRKLSMKMEKEVEGVLRSGGVHRLEGENRAAESEELKQRIEELKQQIEELPVGYISKKNIHNKTRYYRQWTENGKIKSQYIKESELDEVQDQIARRKELQQRLKSLEGERPEGKRQAAPRRRGSSAKTKFQMNVIIGEGLRAMTDNICGEEKRSGYGKLMDYLNGEEDDRVCLVMGLRRTGKTTMIRQAILEMVSFDRQVAYIKATAADTMPVLSSDLRQLYQAGYRHVFVDEVTLMDDFIDSAALLSDIHAAQGMRIVLTGTDSLAFFFALRQELYDRAVIIHTTFIPFREHSRVLGIHNMNDYIQLGGTMRAGEMTKAGTEIDSKHASFRDKDSTKEYVDSAVLRNIRRSIACSKDRNQFENLRILQENGDLEEVVSRVIEI